MKQFQEESDKKIDDGTKKQKEIVTKIEEEIALNLDDGEIRAGFVCGIPV